MLIALLAVLGVDLIVIVLFVAIVLGRRRWLKAQGGAFAGAIRVADGEVEGLSGKWKRGFGHRVRDVLIWNKAPFLFRTQAIPIDQVRGEHSVTSAEVKRLGDAPYVVELVSEEATIEVATRAEVRGLLTGPVAKPA